MEPQKIALVVQRCGLEIRAGAEVYALQLAKALSQAGISVDIYTSCSDDYISWNNKLSIKEVLNKNLTILRFPVKHGRFKIAFAFLKKISFFLRKNFSSTYRKIYAPIFEYFFLRFQGPWCPLLWETLEKNSSQYSLLVVKSYLYAPNVYSLLKTNNYLKKLFIVTAHNEPEFYLNFVRKCLLKSDILGFVSKSEESFCKLTWSFECADKKTLILSPGFFNETIEVKNLRYEISQLVGKKFFLSLGRIDKHKNIQYLLDKAPLDVKIVFAGEKSMLLPSHDERFIYIGSVNEYEKSILFKNTIALLMVSRLEAYSIVTAEALAAGCFVLALKGCDPVDELIGRYGGISLPSKDFLNAMSLLNQGSFDKIKYAPNSHLILKEKTWSMTAQKIIDIIK